MYSLLICDIQNTQLFNVGIERLQVGQLHEVCCKESESLVSNDNIITHTHTHTNLFLQ